MRKDFFVIYFHLLICISVIGRFISFNMKTFSLLRIDYFVRLFYLINEYSLEGSKNGFGKFAISRICWPMLHILAREFKYMNTPIRGCHFD